MTRKKRNRGTDPKSAAPKPVWQGLQRLEDDVDALGNSRVSAARQANIADEEWFRANAGRKYRSRPSIPFEKPYWTGESHLSAQMMMVTRRDDKPGFFWRIPVPGNPSTIPDDERFLMLLWRHIATTSLAVPGGDGRYSRKDVRDIEQFAEGIWKRVDGGNVKLAANS